MNPDIVAARARKKAFAAKAKLARIKHQIRQLLLAGLPNKAEAMARKNQITIEDAKLDPAYGAPALVTRAYADPVLAGTMSAREFSSLPPEPVTLPPPLMSSPVIAAVLPPPPVITRAPNDVGLVNGWPVTATAILHRQPLNRRLMVIRLADGREASMWKQNRNWPIGGKVRVKLDSASADPIYFPHDYLFST